MSGNGNGTDKRLIEDYLPIQAISAEASREKNIRKGHISTLHLWWARRPLVACRAAVYGALVPANRWVKDVDLKNPPADSTKAEAVKNGKAKGLNRAAADRFVTELCQYPGSPRVIQQAQEHILEAHADRLSDELTKAAQSEEWPAWVEEFDWPKDQTQVTHHDIEQGRAPRPRVLDMFAGGGAIPLEALRLGCETYALDLNPVAHIIQLCTLVYPQQFGKQDQQVRGMTGPNGEDGKPTWGGLSEEVQHWGNWVLDRARDGIGDLYPLIPDPRKKRKTKSSAPTLFKTASSNEEVPDGYLMPVAYLWTRTVSCRNPACGATVPLLKQTWLCKKKDRYVALRVVAPRGQKRVRFEVVEHIRESDFDFDPSGFSTGGNAMCPFCGTVADVDYVKSEGWARGLGSQLMAVVGTQPGKKGKIYLAPTDLENPVPPEADVQARLASLQTTCGVSIPNEPIANLPAESTENSLGITVRPYGMRTFGDLFSSRQLLCLLTLCCHTRSLNAELDRLGYTKERREAICTCVAAMVDRLADFNSTGCTWNYTGGRGVLHAMASHRITMTWDYAETNPFNPAGASWVSAISAIPAAIDELVGSGLPAHVLRGSATEPIVAPLSLDAVITDPPYYDNVPYSDIADYFYVWLKRSIGSLFPSDFASSGSPKKMEAIADAGRHLGDWGAAKMAYERMMGEAFRQAHAALKPGGQIAVVYAHKTTLGWSTLVEAFRESGFTITEAWPLDTERSGRLRAMDSAALASSVFLVGRKREADTRTASYEEDVRPVLESIVRERVAVLWNEGITGADLVIAAVGAGLRAFTRYQHVEFANGERVPAERFLAEVEGVVLDVMLEQIAGKVARGVTAVDPRSRFYVLWRYVYKASTIDGGEAIVFTYGQHVELDGQKGVSSGTNPLVEKKKGSYRVRDFSERGKDDKLGLPSDDGEPAPLIDALHRVLWLMEYSPRRLTEFLRESRCNTDQLRVLAQALSGPALKGGEMGQVSAGEELAALTKLTANWRSVIEDALSPLERSH